MGGSEDNTTTARQNGYSCETEGHDSQVFAATRQWQQRNDEMRAKQCSDNPCH